ncbi:hypothetical protein CDL12_28532 [Handroanthus impetiginosus]|uniref:Uncharacterized protein n=1 Tax=Handroanthus impetiginosus TaxID=429701 RepID=A0A2G9G0X8_9LAMI|nr:hypothetical protein CDL12_28532 [Handroanthus impetiginosus]
MYSPLSPSPFLIFFQLQSSFIPISLQKHLLYFSTLNTNFAFCIALMAYSITPFLIILITTSITFPSSLSKNLPSSTISAAPALLPNPVAPSSSPTPALSPDITPLFPSPGRPELSPSDASLPIIPSSPSPPNPDTIAALGPGSAFAPSGLLPDSSSLRLSVPRFLSPTVVCGFVVSLVW